MISTFSPFSGATSNPTPLIHNLSHIKGFSTLSAPKLSTKTVQITRHKLPKTTLKYTKEKSINKQNMEYIHKVHKPNQVKRKLAKPSLSSLGHFPESQLPLNTQGAIKKNKQRTSKYRANAVVSRVYADLDKERKTQRSFLSFLLALFYGVHI